LNYIDYVKQLKEANQLRVGIEPIRKIFLEENPDVHTPNIEKHSQEMHLKIPLWGA
jgi:hypothetical protein